MEIIIRKGKKKTGTISRENRTEWRNERRAKMLTQKGYKPENIAAMMFTKENNIREQHVRKWVKSAVNVKEMAYDKPNL